MTFHVTSVGQPHGPHARQCVYLTDQCHWFQTRARWVGEGVSGWATLAVPATAAAGCEEAAQRYACRWPHWRLQPQQQVHCGLAARMVHPEHDWQWLPSAASGGLRHRTAALSQECMWHLLSPS